MLVDLEAMNQEQFNEYRARCASRSAAEFRYRREACGIELSEISEDLGVRLDTVKRWENPNKGMPPSLRAWAYIDSAYLTLLDAVEAAIQHAEDMDCPGIETDGSDGVPNAQRNTLDMQQRVHLVYRRGAAPARNGVTVGRSNALSRAIGIALTALGYEIEVDWVDDKGNGSAARY